MQKLFPLIIGAAMIFLNTYAVIVVLGFKEKFSKTRIIIFYSLFCVVILSALYFAPEYYRLLKMDLWFLIPILIAPKGKITQKLFMLFTMVFMCCIMMSLVGFVLQYILPMGTNLYIWVYLVCVLAVYGLYFAFLRRKGKVFYQNLFHYTGQTLWVAYTIYVLIATAAFQSLYVEKGIRPQAYINEPFRYLAFVFLALWGFFAMAFFIIRSNQRTEAKYELQLMNSLMSSEKAYYSKIQKYQEDIRIMRHDYKHQLSTIDALLKNGQPQQAEQLLTRLEEHYKNTAIPYYCENSILNAQIGEFASRCEEENIDFTVKISLPQSISLENHELCALVGNFLENAHRGCTTCAPGQKKWISLDIIRENDKTLFRAQNSFDGIVKEENNEILSRKTGGGLGLKSMRAIAEKYSGELVTSWNDNTFKAYVIIE